MDSRVALNVPGGPYWGTNRVSSLTSAPKNG